MLLKMLARLLQLREMFIILLGRIRYTGKLLLIRRFLVVEDILLLRVVLLQFLHNILELLRKCLMTLLFQEKKRLMKQLLLILIKCLIWLMRLKSLLILVVFLSLLELRVMMVFLIWIVLGQLLTLSLVEQKIGMAIIYHIILKREYLRNYMVILSTNAGKKS